MHKFRGRATPGKVSALTVLAGSHDISAVCTIFAYFFAHLQINSVRALACFDTINPLLAQHVPFDVQLYSTPHVFFSTIR